MLRVLTLNLWNLERWRERREEVLAWFRLLEPDIVCLQEVVENSDGRNQVRWLAERTASTPHVACGPAGSVASGTTFGNGILSRWPIDATEVVALPSASVPGDVDRAVTWARTRGVDVFCTHLSSPFEAVALRRRQVVRLVEVVNETADPRGPLPPVLAGDFNAEPDADEIRHLCGLTTLQDRVTYFQDAWRVAGGGGPGWTWDNRNPFAAAEYEPDRRIDYVFVGWRGGRGSGRVEAARVVCDRALGGAYASDHYGLLAQVAET
jgi:endonuclease/exonuclease/phosphatase family metal-dependent hydrolase